MQTWILYLNSGQYIYNLEFNIFDLLARDKTSCSFNICLIMPALYVMFLCRYTNTKHNMSCTIFMCQYTIIYELVYHMFKFAGLGTAKEPYAVDS